MKFENAVNLGAIKITMQQFYRPNGDSTQSRGVLADVVLPSFSSHLSKGEKDLDYALEFDKVPAAAFRNVEGMISNDVVAALRQKSEERRKNSNDFAGLEQEIQHYEEDLARKSVPLQEEKFRELRKETDAEKTEREQFETLENRNNGVERDFYLDEVLAITADYVAGMPDQVAAN
jgi:carboxyl-terminal processing protease